VYESIALKHSWNAPQVMSNYLFFKLQRHSDHHANAYKPYQILDSIPESPMLPYGYTVSLILCMFPYVWFKVMDPLAEAANRGEKLDAATQRRLDRWIGATLTAVALALSYLNFVHVGFTYRQESIFF
jgi:hypothetical protein